MKLQAKWFDRFTCPLWSALSSRTMHGKQGMWSNQTFLPVTFRHGFPKKWRFAPWVKYQVWWLNVVVCAFCVAWLQLTMCTAGHDGGMECHTVVVTASTHSSLKLWSWCAVSTKQCSCHSTVLTCSDVRLLMGHLHRTSSCGRDVSGCWLFWQFDIYLLDAVASILSYVGDGVYRSKIYRSC